MLLGQAALADAWFWLYLGASYPLVVPWRPGRVWSKLDIWMGLVLLAMVRGPNVFYLLWVVEVWLLYQAVQDIVLVVKGWCRR